MSKKCHMIGIGGIGMSGLARFMLDRGHEVSGSDIAASYVTEGLEKDGAKVYIGHSEKFIAPDMTVIYNTDIKSDNPEYVTAKNMNCKLLHRSDLLRDLMEGHKGLLVAGTHGKTTTSSLLSWVITEAKLDPSFAVGGIVHSLGTNAKPGKGEFFVVEACESDGTFLKYPGFGAIVTNIGLDHLDFHKTEENLIKSFHNFLEKVESKQHLFWCGDDSRLINLNMPGIPYGFGESCKLRAKNYFQSGWMICYDIEFQDKTYPRVEVALTGKHNALNALAVFGLAITLGIDEQVIRQAFRTFKGVKRRSEKKGVINGVQFYDDYAHYPTEVKATLSAVRAAIGEQRLIAIYQPHRYSRTRDCLHLTKGMFDSADHVFITDIYSANEQPIEGITTERVIDEVKNSHKVKCVYASREQLADTLAAFVQPHDVIITLGAGDITKVGYETIEKIKKQSPRKLKIGLVFGGRSVEHEVSIQSANTLVKSLNPDIYEIESIGITKDGTWEHRSNLHEEWKNKPNLSKSAQGPHIPHDVITKLQELDVVFPILHGTYGEDGTLQGLLEMIDKPYVGCDWRASALVMDKALTKTVVQAHGIATAPFISFNAYEWQQEPLEIVKQIQNFLSFPIYVKPSHLGSSVAVQKVEDHSTLFAAIDKVFEYDTHAVVENGIVGGREIGFAVFGNNRLTVLPPGEYLTGGKFYDYDSKYGDNAWPEDAIASLPKERADEGRQLAAQAYRATGCCGWARVDFFYDHKERFIFNEINPIPGLTKASLFPKMIQANNIPLNSFFDHLLILALERHRRKQKNV